MNKKSSVFVWATAVSKHLSEEKAIVFRYAKELAPDFDRSSQPDRVILVWKYNTEKGMPPPEDQERMEELEDLLRPIVEDTGLATLAIVSTGDNVREWTYYAKSESQFLSKLNEAFREKPRFPIEIHAGPDPNWSSYENFRSGVEETSHETI
jgi:hypothetical protein